MIVFDSRGISLGSGITAKAYVNTRTAPAASSAPIGTSQPIFSRMRCVRDFGRTFFGFFFRPNMNSQSRQRWRVWASSPYSLRGGLPVLEEAESKPLKREPGNGCDARN